MTPQYNMCDPDFGEVEVKSRVKKQGALLLVKMEARISDWIKRFSSR